MNAIVEALVCRLNESLRELFEERAGILQFEAGYERELAEALALLEVIRAQPFAVSRLRCLSCVFAGEQVLVVGLDDTTRPRLALLAAAGGEPVDIPLALSSLGGVARLIPLAEPPKN